MNVVRLSLAGLVALVVLAVPAVAAELGDAAPGLKVEKWVKGGPVDVKDGKNIYVVEFWATWCGPCRASMPHLTELQKEYKDKGVVVVGVSIDEGEKRKTRDKVEAFVKENEAKLGYTIALDEAAKTTENAYMDGFEFGGIPTAFVIDKNGKVVWAGQAEETPAGTMSWAGLDKAVEAVVADKHDLKAAQKADKERRVLAEKLSKYYALVALSEKPEGAEKAGQEVVAAIGKDAGKLNELAWNILTSTEIKFRDLKLALAAAKAAYDATDGKSAAVIDTYARALFDTGSKKEAIEYEKKAIQLAGDNAELRKELEDALKRYEEAGEK
jgi:thiol-disulfide isomerase/thioredoxin